MAASRISTNTHLTASKNDRRQAEARIRALQHRTNTLHEELTRTSANANSAVYDVEQTYLTLMQDLQDQRDQLIRRIQNAKQNIQHSTKELNGIRKHLRSTQSFHPTQNSSGHSTDLETNNLNAMIDDTERVLTQIAQQLKQYRFKPTTNRSYPKSLGKIEIDKINLRQDQPTRTMMYDYNPMENLSVHKLYVIDLDISPDWVAVSFDDRIFICDVEGETRIYSYSNHFHRQPILTERFHLSSIRLLSTFTVTHDYLIAFESDTQMLNLYKHHGALIVRIRFPYDPLMIIHSDYHGKNEIWSCSRTKRQCLHFKIHHTMKELHPIEQLDFKQPIVNILIDPVGISVDENDRIAVHDVNSTTSDRLLLFTNHFNKIIPLDLIKYADRQLTSRIDRVLLVPNQPNLIILIYSPQPTLPANEIVILDIEIQPTRILHRFSEPYGIRNIDITSNSELVYCVTPPANKRLASKMFVYSLIN